MRDMYNDSTGSRKKFLIPLVVLLLCAVSLTGAGYAYQSSVTVNDAGAQVDEYYTLDIYDMTSGKIIAQKIDAGSVDGIVFTTDKIIGENATSSDLTGKFELEHIDGGVILYTGLLAITADEITNTTEIEPATVNLMTTDLAAEFVDGTLYSVDDGKIDVSIKFYQYVDDHLGAEVTDGKFVVNNDGTATTKYVYRIFVDAVEGTVNSRETDHAEANWSASAFAANAIKTDGTGVTIKFGYKLTAYQADTFTVTYHEKIGEAAAVTTGEVGLYTTGTAFNLGTPTKVGYTFGGWFTNADCNGDAITSIAADATGDKDVYAKWTAYTYQVVFNKNSDAATGTMAAQDMTYDTEAALIANAFSNDGYSFAGWATTADGAVVYTDGQAVKNLTEVNEGNVNLYAKWTENP